MKKRLLTLGGIALVSAVLLHSRGVSADGLGVYPAQISVQDAARGAVYYKDLGVLNSESTDLVVEPLREGEVGQWISISTATDRSTPLDKLTVPAQSTTRFLARIQVPETADNGEHGGSLTLQSRGPAAQAEGGQGVSSVYPAVEIDLGVSVSGIQNLAGRVLDMYTNDTEVNYPLRVTTFFENTGNVDARPQVTVRIKNAKPELVGDNNASALIHPGENGFIRNQWATNGQVPGDYVADVAVNLGEATIQERAFNFKILPYGTLTRRGALEALVLVNKPETGGVAKVEARFRNTGIIDTRALFQGEVYRDDKLVEVLTTPEKMVAPGDIDPLEVFFNIRESGTYTVRGKVNYEGKETAVQELTFEVAGGGLSIWLLLGGGAAAVGLVLGAGWVLPRRLGISPFRMLMRLKGRPSAGPR